MKLKRTQIYLKPEQHSLLKREAERRGISLSELIRRLIGEHLETNHSGESNSIVGLGESGKSNIAEKHDRYLGEAVGGGTEK
ncbi:MAG: CopG family transcriptional regulator [Candidatus Bipolaricaulia bacterium]